MVSSPPGQFLLGDQRLPAPPHGPSKFDAPLFYDGRMSGKSVRVAALYLRIGTPERPQVMLVQVAKSTTARSVLAGEILVDTVSPLAMLMLATSVVVWAGIARGLSPLRKLRRQVENRSPRDLTPLELENAPTEVMALVHALNTLLSEVGRQVERQRRFIADAAHQLRTPLAGLKSQTEVAQRELGEPQPDLGLLRQRLNRLEASADRGIRLVNQLLALARAEPDAPLSMAPLDLARLLRELAREVAPRALAKGLDLAVEGLDQPLLISGNDGLVRELFANLLNNAVAYTPAGGEITVRLSDRREHALVEVADTGPGIPATERDAVFERFYRGALQANEHGCGLGLPIAREIARRHGASIALADTAPHGLSVSVAFPLTTGESR
jgi:two-component system sensor histidine kinase TctE